MSCWRVCGAHSPPVVNCCTRPAQCSRKKHTGRCLRSFKRILMQRGSSCPRLRRSSTPRDSSSLIPGMMAFSTPCCTRAESAGSRCARWLALVLLLASAVVHAEGIHVKSAELSAIESSYVLDANYEIVLSHTLEEALLRGLPLHFVVDFELTKPRGWTFGLWSRTVAAFRQQHRLS